MCHSLIQQEAAELSKLLLAVPGLGPRLHELFANCLTGNADALSRRSNLVKLAECDAPSQCSHRLRSM